MQLPWREYPFILADVIKNSDIPSFYYSAILSVFETSDAIHFEYNDFSNKVQTIEYAKYEHNANTIVISHKNNIFSVGVWDTDQFNKSVSELDMFLKYDTYTNHTVFSCYSKDITLQEVLNGSDYRLKHAANQHLLLNDVADHEKHVIANRGQCVLTNELLRRHLDFYDFLTKRDLLFNKFSPTTLELFLIVSATTKFNVLYGHKNRASELFEQIEYVYEQGLALKDTFYFNDDDYKVWRPYPEHGIVCLKDQEILFVISKLKDGYYIQTTCESDFENTLIDRVVNELQHTRDKEKAHTDLSIWIEPDNIILLGAHLYSLAIDILGAVRALQEELSTNQDLAV